VGSRRTTTEGEKPEGTRGTDEERVKEDEGQRNRQAVGQKAKKLCRDRQESAFVAAWLLQALHELLDLGHPTVRATDEQVMELMDLRSGGKILQPDYYKLKSLFITRVGRPASRCELLVEVVKGSRQSARQVGIPSEYELGAFGWLLELECQAGDVEWEPDYGEHDRWGPESSFDRDGPSFDAEDISAACDGPEPSWDVDGFRRATEAQEDGCHCPIPSRYFCVHPSTLAICKCSGKGPRGLRRIPANLHCRVPGE
jgi:hypothetical protein